MMPDETLEAHPMIFGKPMLRIPAHDHWLKDVGLFVCEVEVTGPLTVAWSIRITPLHLLGSNTFLFKSVCETTERACLEIEQALGEAIEEPIRKMRTV